MKAICLKSSFRKLRLPLLLAALVMLGNSCSTLDQNPLTIDPRADAALRAMSNKLAASQQFSFHTSRTIDAALVLGTSIDESAQIDMFVKRPNQIRGITTTPQGKRHLLYDGSKVITYNEKRNEYASQEAPGTIDEVIDSISGDWGVRPPLSDIFVSDPYRSLTHEGGVVNHVGSESIDGTQCDHLKATLQSLDWELWIGQKDQLPRKLVITIKARDGSPKISSRVSQWNLSPHFAADLFTIKIPQNASQTNLIRSH
ncbi:MAG: DUF2092 domain-containing protein [Verrucomicrobiota bacterium]